LGAGSVSPYEIHFAILEALLKYLEILCLAVISVVLLSSCQNSSRHIEEVDSNIKTIKLQMLDEQIYKTIGEGRFYTADFSPDEKILAVGTSVSIIFYDTSNYQEIRTIPASFVDKLKWSPNGNFLAVAEGSQFYIYDYSLNKVIELQDGEQVLNTDQISWSPNGKYIAATTLLMYHANAWVWEVSSTNKISDLALKNEFAVYKYANGVHWSSDSTKLALSFNISDMNNLSTPSQLTLWDFATKSPKLISQWVLPDYRPDKGEVPQSGSGTVYWTPDDKFIVVASSSNITVLDASNGDIKKQIVTSQQILTVWLSNKKLILVTGNKSIIIQAYNIPDLEKLGEIKYSENSICVPAQIQFNSCGFENASISPSASTLITSNSFNDEFYVLSAKDEVALKSIFLGSHWNNDLAFSSDNRYVVTLGQDDLVRSYSIDDLELIDTVNYNDSSIAYLHLNGKYTEQATEISPDGKLSAHIEEDTSSECFLIFCTPGTKYKLTISRISSNEILRSIGLQKTSMEISWSPDSNWLITAGDPTDGSIPNFGLIIVPIETNKQAFLITNIGPIKGLDWSDDGKYIGETGYNGVIRIFMAKELLDSFHTITSP